MKAFLFAVLLWSVPQAQALFVKSQMDRIDTERLLDSEYFSDLQSFSYPLDWELPWRDTSGSYRANGASLDCCDLLWMQELKLRKQLTTGLAFRFRLVQKEDKERQDLHHWLEFEQRVYGGFSAILFGEPSFHKEDADIGLGFSYRRGTWLHLRATQNWVDFNFNSRNSSEQRYSRKPLTQELLLELKRGPHFLEVTAELDQPLGRDVPAEARHYFYRRAALGVAWRKSSSPYTAAGYSYEFHSEGNRFDPGAAGSPLLFRRQAHRFFTQAQWDMGSRDVLEAGHVLLLRAARSDSPIQPLNGVFYRRWELEPYARWRRNLGPVLAGELASFLSLGEDRRRYGAGRAANEVLIEAKLGAGLDFKFSSAGRVGIYTTFDLDALGRHFWDGGNIRALFFF